MGMTRKVFCWLRRDLRLTDNHALFKALSSGYNVQLLFIFDTDIINTLPKDDPRISIIYDQLHQLQKELSFVGSSLLVRKGFPENVLRELIAQEQPVAIYANEDYEPYALKRDKKIARIAKKGNIDFLLYKDQVIFSPSEILKKNKEPYTVFTPWFNKWYAQFFSDSFSVYPSKELLENTVKSDYKIPEIHHVGFAHVQVDVNTRLPSKELLNFYEQDRDFPAKDGTSRLGVALRFGMIGIRELALHAVNHKTYLSELAWREFYMMILYYFRQVVHQSFKKKYDNIQWLNNEENFEKWKQGQTGYPLVDAGMRQLSETGYMHNRLRMLTASFLTKHLLTDWRWGEAWFAEKLHDYELASNNGGWQWAAGTGCDAAPYFRIFNPETQAKKFDSKSEFIHTYIPEIKGSGYAQPIVDHKYARQRALNQYKLALSKM